MQQNEVNFLTFCIEEFKRVYSVSGTDIYNLFKKYGVLDYLLKTYDVEHTLDTQIIFDDILYVLKKNGCDINATFSRV